MFGRFLEEKTNKTWTKLRTIKTHIEKTISIQPRKRDRSEGVGVGWVWVQKNSH